MASDAKPVDEYQSAGAGGRAEVAVFDQQDRGLVGRLRHALPVNPSLAPPIVLVAAIIAFGAMLGSRFFSPLALTLILRQAQIIGIVAAARSLVILTAGIDQSVGAVMVIAVVMGRSTFRCGLPPSVAMACGAALGAVNGWLVSRVSARCSAP